LLCIHQQGHVIEWRANFTLVIEDLGSDNGYLKADFRQ